MKRTPIGNRLFSAVPFQLKLESAQSCKKFEIYLSYFSQVMLMCGLCTRKTSAGTSAITSAIRTVISKLWSQQSTDSKVLANNYF